MTIAELRAAKYAEPFRPFRLLLAAGRAVLVEQPTAIAWSERGERIAVMGEGTAVFDLGEVTDLVAEPEGGAARAAGGRQVTGTLLIPGSETVLTVEARAGSVILSAGAASGFKMRLVLAVHEADALAKALQDAAEGGGH